MVRDCIVASHAFTDRVTMYRLLLNKLIENIAIQKIPILYEQIKKLSFMCQ